MKTTKFENNVRSYQVINVCVNWYRHRRQWYFNESHRNFIFAKIFWTKQRDDKSKRNKHSFIDTNIFRIVVVANDMNISRREKRIYLWPDSWLFLKNDKRCQKMISHQEATTFFNWQLKLSFAKCSGDLAYHFRLRVPPTRTEISFNLIIFLYLVTTSIMDMDK